MQFKRPLKCSSSWGAVGLFIKGLNNWWMPHGNQFRSQPAQNAASDWHSFFPLFFFFFFSFLPLFTLFCLRWLLCQRSQKQREKLMAKGTNEPLSVGPELVRHKGMSVKKSLDMWLLQTWLEGWLDGWFRMFLWGKAGLIFFFFFSSPLRSLLSPDYTSFKSSELPSTEIE